MINNNCSIAGIFSKNPETIIDINRKLSDIILEEINGKFFQIDCLANVEGSRDYIRKQIDFEYDVSELIISAKEICNEYGKAKRSQTGTNNSKEGDLNVAVGQLLLNTNSMYYDDDVHNYTTDIVEMCLKRSSSVKVFADKNTGTQDEQQNLGERQQKTAAVRPAKIPIKHSCVNKDSPPKRKKPIRCVSRAKFHINKRINVQIPDDQHMETHPKCTQTDPYSSLSVPNKNLADITWHEMLQLAKNLKGSSPCKDSSSETDGPSSEFPANATEADPMENVAKSKSFNQPPMQNNAFFPGCDVQVLPPLSISKPLKIQSVHKIEILPSKKDQHSTEQSNNRYIHLLHDEEVSSSNENYMPLARPPPTMEPKSIAIQTAQPNAEKPLPQIQKPTKHVNKYLEPFINSESNRSDSKSIAAKTSSSIDIDDDQTLASELSSTNDEKEIRPNSTKSSKRKTCRRYPHSIGKSSGISQPLNSSTDEDDLSLDFNKLDLKVNPKLWLDLIEDVFSAPIHDETNPELSTVRRSPFVGETIEKNTKQIPISKTPSPICIVDFDHTCTEMDNSQNAIVDIPNGRKSVHLYRTESSTQTLKMPEPPMPTEQPLQPICHCVYCNYRIQPSCCPHQPTTVQPQQYLPVPSLNLNRIESIDIRNETRPNYLTPSMSSSSDSSIIREKPLTKPLPSERYKTLKKSLTVPLDQTQSFAKTLTNIYATAEQYKYRSHDELYRIGASYQEDYTIQRAADRFLRSVERERNSAGGGCTTYIEIPPMSARLLAMQENSADAETLSGSSSRNIDFMCTNSEESSTGGRDDCIEIFARNSSATVSKVTSSNGNSETVDSNDYDVYDSSIEYHIKQLKDFGITPSRTSLMSSGGGSASGVTTNRLAAKATKRN